MRDSQTGQFVSTTEAKAVPVIMTDTQYTYGPTTITLKRDGQESATNSDNIRVKVTISLPNNESEYLDPKYQFGSRVQLFDETLHSTWGNNHTKYRENSEIFKADRWHKAFTQAKEYAEIEADKLIVAINLRDKALLNAEKLT